MHVFEGQRLFVQRGRLARTVIAPGGGVRVVFVIALRLAFRLAPGAEIALEANPEDAEPERLRSLAMLGINRLTLGVQSLDDRLLGLMRRPHDARRALEALEAARRSPIGSLGADLILGLPGQDAPRTLRDITRIVDAGVDHLSLYLLEIHAKTRLGREVALRRIVPMNDDAAADLYEAAADLLEGLGFEHYEISNFARPGHRSRQNLKYWTDQDYLGFGPAAHSYLGGRRWSNRPDLASYIASGGIGQESIEESGTPADRAAEALCAGLRLIEGVDLEHLRARHGPSVPLPDEPAIGALVGAGLLQLTGSRLRLTRRGRLVSNEVLERLLAASRVGPEAAFGRAVS